VHVPPLPFQSILAAVVAGKLRGADLVIDDFSRSSGRIHSFYTVDPDDPLETISTSANAVSARVMPAF
jgi:hypothetical protein